MPDTDRKKRISKISLCRPTWVEIDLNAIRHNFAQVRRIVGPAVKILTVVKADAYGHGMVEVSRKLESCGADYFGVASMAEAASLRSYGIKKPILIFEVILVDCIPELLAHNVTATAFTLPFIRAFSRQAQKEKKVAKIHIKVDTGMGRLGVWHEDALPFIKEALRFPAITIEGVYTHFSSADTDREFTHHQIACFKRLKRAIELSGIHVPLYHAANSMGVIDYRESHFNLVRPGLMLYGLYPKKGLMRTLCLKPAMSFKTRVVHLKNVPAGRSISYGRTFITDKTTAIATVPVGYHDGYFRRFSNKAEVIIRGKRFKIVGRVCMDQCMVDVGGNSAVKVGDTVALLGRSGRKEISADELAEAAQTISYEVVCALGKAQNRFFKRG